MENLLISALDISGVTASAVGYLRGQIISGGLAPGQKLNETEISEQLGVSRPPLREAFRILAQEYLVISIPRRGTFVRQLSYEDLEAVYRAREMVECAVINVFEAKKITRLPEVEETISQASKLHLGLTGDTKQMLFFRKEVTDFHSALVQKADNPYITHFYFTLYFNLARYQYIQFRTTPESMEHSVKEHFKILKMIENQQYQEAREHLKKHLRYAFDLQKKALVKSLLAAGEKSRGSKKREPDINRYIMA